MNQRNYLSPRRNLLFVALCLLMAAVASSASAQSNTGHREAELVANRGFEASLIPADWRVEGTNVFTPRGARIHKWFTNDLSGWHATAENGAEGEIAQDSESPTNERSPRTLKLTIKKPAGRFAVVNDAFRNLNVRSNEWVDLNFRIRAEPRENPRWGYSLTCSLES